MPRKKTENTPEAKRQDVVAKVSFFSLLALLVLFTNMFVSQQPKLRQSKRVLGESNTPYQLPSEKDFQKQIAELNSQVQRLKAEVEAASLVLLGKGKDQATEKTTEFIQENTLKPLISRFQDLPEEQQEYVRDAVCKQ